jgi:hypothetical protein
MNYLYDWMQKKSQGRKVSSFASTVNEIADCLIYCEIDQDITHIASTHSTFKKLYVVLRDRVTQVETLQIIGEKSEHEKSVKTNFGSPIKSIFCLDISTHDFLLILTEDGKLRVFNEKKE